MVYVCVWEDLPQSLSTCPEAHGSALTLVRVFVSLNVLIGWGSPAPHQMGVLCE